MLSTRVLGVVGPCHADVAGYVAEVAAAVRQDTAAARAGLPVFETTFSTWTLTARKIRTDPMSARLATAVFPLDSEWPSLALETSSLSLSPSSSPHEEPAGRGGTAVTPRLGQLAALELNHRQLVRTQRNAIGAAAAGREEGPKRRSSAACFHLDFRALDVANDAEVAAVVRLVNACYRGGQSWTDESALVDGLRVTEERLRCYASEAEILMAVVPAAAAGNGPVDARAGGDGGDGGGGGGGGGGRRRRSPPAVVGVVKHGWTDSTVVGPLDARAYYLGMLAVDPGWQSRGLGAALADRVEATAKLAGAPRVVMDVLDVREELLAWYGRRGYVRTGGSTPAKPFIEEKGERLLVDCRFVVLEKRL
ncbi:hypothetical protein MMPV_003830 [Pyropia vietnamensis]